MPVNEAGGGNVNPSAGVQQQPTLLDGGEVLFDAEKSGSAIVSIGPPRAVEDDGAIEGGGIQSNSSVTVSAPRDLEKSRAVLATGLLALLALTVFGHYLAVLVLAWNGKKEVDALSTAFNASLPVVSGLVGSAVTYYFTKGHESK